MQCDVVTGHLDFVHFVYGLSLIMLAAVCLGIREDRSRLPWNWLALYGLLKGGKEWLDLPAASFGDSTVFFALRTLILIAAFVVLAQFARGLLRKTTRANLGLWALFLGLLLTASGGLAGWSGLNAAAGYSLCLAGGLGAAWLVHRQSSRVKVGSACLQCVAITLAAHTLLAALIPPAAPFWPASQLNLQNFHDVMGVPVQLLRAVMVLLLAGAVWAYRLRLRQNAAITSTGWNLASGAVFAATLTIVLAGGWWAARWAGRQADATVRNDLMRLTQTAIIMLDGNEVASLTSSPADLDSPVYWRHHAVLTAVAKANPDVKWLYTMRFRQGAIYFAVDGTETTSPSFAAPGDLYADAPAELKEAFFSGAAATFGPYRDRYGVFISSAAPVRDAAGRVVAVLGVDIVADKWQHAIATSRLVWMMITGLIATLLSGLYAVGQRFVESRDTLAVREREKAGILDGLKDIVVEYLDPQMRILWTNAAGQEAFGKRGDIRGRLCYEAIHGRKEPCDGCTAMKALDTGVFQDGETQTPDGRSWQLRSNPIKDGSGRAVGVVHVAMNVTERRAALQALRESEERYRSLFENCGEGLFLLNDRFLECNEQACRMLGWPREESLGRTPAELSPHLQPDG